VPGKKFRVKDLTIAETEDILKQLYRKYEQDRDTLAQFLPHIVNLLDKRIGTRRTSKQQKKPSTEKKGGKTDPKLDFTLIDEFLTEREKKARLNNALSLLNEFRKTGSLSEEEMKKCLVNVVLSGFQSTASSQELELLTSIVERLLGINLTNETEKEFTFADSTVIKKYTLTDRINVYLDRNFSLAKIEITGASNLSGSDHAGKF
jgi:hypothetical protein